MVKVNIIALSAFCVIVCAQTTTDGAFSDSWPVPGFH